MGEWVGESMGEGCNSSIVPILHPSLNCTLLIADKLWGGLASDDLYQNAGDFDGVVWHCACFRSVGRWLGET